MDCEELFAVLGYQPINLADYTTNVLDVYKITKGICPQYEEDTRRCKIYEHPHRPEACRRYPFVTRNGSGERGIGVRASCEFTRTREGLMEFMEFVAEHDLYLIEEC